MVGSIDVKRFIRPSRRATRRACSALLSSRCTFASSSWALRNLAEEAACRSRLCLLSST
jgi:hypothetical protein